MPDPHSAPHAARAHERPGRFEDKRSFFRRLIEFLNPGVDSTHELIDALAEAEDKQLIDADSRVMLEGVLRLAEMTAKEVMVPTPRMDMLDIDAPYEALLRTVIDTAHSRFPVYQGERENVTGILMAKDLLKLQRAPELSVRTLVRPAMFVPESKGLNDLLRAFRINRNHMAIVVDEFGRMAGLITIEDVLEQIVGEIEDEFDDEAETGDIFALADGTWRVAGHTPLEKVNEAFGVHLGTVADADLPVAFDTIGGLVAHEMGRVPVRGEQCTLGGLQLRVLLTKGGAVRWFRVLPLARPALKDEAS